MRTIRKAYGSPPPAFTYHGCRLLSRSAAMGCVIMCVYLSWNASIVNSDSIFAENVTAVMFTAPVDVAARLSWGRIARPKADTVLLIRAAKLIVAMRECDGWGKRKKPWLMSLRIPPLCVLSYIPSCKIRNHDAVFAVLTAKLWRFFHPGSVFCAVLAKGQRNIY